MSDVILTALVYACCSPFLVLYLGLDVVGGIHFEGVGLSTLSEESISRVTAFPVRVLTKMCVLPRRLLDVVVRKTVTILHPAADKIQVLLIR